jgi:signal transduction histidine kinase
MTIRTRLTIWYSGVLFACLLLFGIVSYYELVIERRQEVFTTEKPASETERLAINSREERWIMSEIAEVVFWYSLPAGILGLVGGAWMTRKILAPISTLTKTAERISEHNLKERLTGSGNGDELDRLTRVFNDMTTRLDNSFQRIREFTLHASHELKTPLTILHAELETALSDAACPPAQREHLQNQLNEIDRLARIVDGLTLLTKADAGLVALKWDSFPFDELVQETFADAQILARPTQLQVTLVKCEAMTILGDRHRLRQLLLNLTDNAVKYNTPGGTITISLHRDGNMAEYCISNTGPGVPESDRQRIFERFFRSSTSTRDDVEGSGLGLSIAQWIIGVHGGTIRLLSGAGSVTHFVVRLPLTHAGVQGRQANLA